MRLRMSFPAFVCGILATLMLMMVLTTGSAEAAVTYRGSISVAGMTGPFTVVLEPGVGASFTSPIGPGSIAASQNGAVVSGMLLFANPAYQPCNFTAIVAGAQVDGVLDAGTCGGPGVFRLVQGGGSPSPPPRQGCGNPCTTSLERFGPFRVGSTVAVMADRGASISGATGARIKFPYS